MIPMTISATITKQLYTNALEKYTILQGKNNLMYKKQKNV